MCSHGQRCLWPFDRAARPFEPRSHQTRLLPLRRGQRVEVLSVGKHGGWLEGRYASSSGTAADDGECGWFPARCLLGAPPPCPAPETPAEDEQECSPSATEQVHADVASDVTALAIVAFQPEVIPEAEEKELDYLQEVRPAAVQSVGQHAWISLSEIPAPAPPANALPALCDAAPPAQVGAGFQFNASALTFVPKSLVRPAAAPLMLTNGAATAGCSGRPSAERRSRTVGASLAAKREVCVQVVTLGLRWAGLSGRSSRNIDLSEGVRAYARGLGMIDLKDCNLFFDARCFWDPQSGDLRRHVGTNPVILERLVGADNFPWWLHRAKRQFRAERRAALTAARGGPAPPEIKMAVFCNGGRHRAVAAGTILKHVMMTCEGAQCAPPCHLSLSQQGVCKCSECTSSGPQQRILEKAAEIWRNLE